jgi:MOSC domain-containing protein YiiM
MPRRLSPLFSWLAGWRPDELRGTLTDIYVATSAGAPMRRVTEIRAIAGAGLQGDRYASGSGHWRRTDACEVTLVDAADVERAQRKSGIAFGAGEHRRNLVVRGIPLDAYRDRQLRIGEVLLEFHRLRPPCGYLDRLLARGASKALGRGAGIGLRVVEGGTLRVGDGVELLQKPRTG